MIESEKDFIGDLELSSSSSSSSEDDEILIKRKPDLIDFYLEKIRSSENESDGWAGESGMERLLGALDNIAVGADASYSSFTTILFFLARYPEFQETARKEMESIGSGDYFEKKELPFCHAFIAETQRFSSESGLGGMHVLEQEVEYKGMILPKNVSVVLT